MPNAADELPDTEAVKGQSSLTATTPTQIEFGSEVSSESCIQSLDH